MNKQLTTSEIAGHLEAISPPVRAPNKGLQNLRKVLFVGLAAKVLLTGAVYFGYDALIGSRYVTTDNAYVAADTAQVASQIAGPVKQVLVKDTDRVQAGDVLVVLDDTDARLALAQAEASLAQAERRVRGYFANDEGLAAQVGARSADMTRAQAQIGAAEADLERARVDLQRREALVASGSVSGEELTRARNAFQQAEAALDAAHAMQAQSVAAHAAAIGTLKANAAMTANTTVDSNPEVAVARARVEQARVELERTIVRAPINGVIARREVQMGERVQPGTPLLNVVPIEQAFVEANFKESQLAKVREGQKVELTSDLYGSDVIYHGQVVGLAGGTGSSFAIIPTQNATGNWIKVVQRVPVRIALDWIDLRQHPLRAGLSMTATIDTAE
jgi:membrane fusion protein, multidrug efflux system